MVKRVFYLLGVVALAAGLIFGPACDDSNNGGGGPTPGATANLAGEWELKWVVAPGVGLWGKMIVDASGNVTKYISPIWWCGPVYSVRVSGALVKEGEYYHVKIYHACPGWPPNVTWLDIYKLKMVSADRMHGSIVAYLNKILVMPKWAIIAIRR